MYFGPINEIIANMNSHTGTVVNNVRKLLVNFAFSFSLKCPGQE
jgi:hypothetical protein